LLESDEFEEEEEWDEEDRARNQQMSLSHLAVRRIMDREDNGR